MSKIYLYLKTHKISGLKYLGKTSGDPYKYNGSGVVWRDHLKKYGTSEIHTEILFETTSEYELREKGLYYSNLWNIVESKEFANLREESGDGWVPGRSLSEEHRKKIGIKSSGSNNGMYGRDRSGNKNPMYGAKREGTFGKKILIDNICFKSCIDASKHFKVSKSTISFWLNSNKAKIIEVDLE